MPVSLLPVARQLALVKTKPVGSPDILCFKPQWGAADAEIKVPSGENTELKRFPFIAWSRSVYSHTCYAYCQGFLPCLFLPFQSIHLHFFQNLSRFLLYWLWLAHRSCVCHLWYDELEIEWSLCSALIQYFVVDWAQSTNWLTNQLNLHVWLTVGKNCSPNFSLPG